MIANHLPQNSAGVSFRWHDRHLQWLEWLEVTCSAGCQAWNKIPNPAKNNITLFTNVSLFHCHSKYYIYAFRKRGSKIETQWIEIPNLTSEKFLTVDYIWKSEWVRRVQHPTRQYRSFQGWPFQAECTQTHNNGTVSLTWACTALTLQPAYGVLTLSHAAIHAITKALFVTASFRLHNIIFIDVKRCFYFIWSGYY